MKKLNILLIALFVIALLAGCGSSEKTIKTDQGSVTVDDNKVEVKTDDGKSQISVADEKDGAVSLPDDYPANIVPIIDGGKVTVATRNEDAHSKVGYWINVVTDKDAKEVYNFYLDALKDATETQKFEMNGTYSVNGIKDGKAVTVAISSGENDQGKKETNVIISIATQ